MADHNLPPGAPLVILLVEDNPAHAEVIRCTVDAYRIANRLQHVADRQMVASLSTTMCSEHYGGQDDAGQEPCAEQTPNQRDRLCVVNRS